jgi:nucleotide-binding universal stress UspA family protein
LSAAVRRLLVGFDGNPAALGALRHAVRLARRNHGRLVVVCVVPENARGVVVSPLGLCVALPEDPDQSAARLVRAVRERVPDSVSVVTVVRRGRVGAALAAEAERFGCDAIVIGAHHSLWSRVSGGVERYLRRHSQIRLIVDQQRSARRVAPRDRSGPPIGVRAHPA